MPEREIFATDSVADRRRYHDDNANSTCGSFSPLDRAVLIEMFARPSSDVNISIPKRRRKTLTLAA
jgi:hypothetical protein